jgi:hypothetical protein
MTSGVNNMASHFGWVDFAEDDRRRMLDVVKLFQERETRDELGIGTIRDAFADYFFPGTSTIQTRARYMLFVPWIYKELEQKGVSSADIGKRAREIEISLIFSLLKSGETQGIIGMDSKEKLKRLPSNIYWVGLGSWGIRLYPGSQEQYHRSINIFYRNKARLKEQMVEELTESIHENWDPGLPKTPKNYREAAVLSLSLEEAEYLQHRIVCQHCSVK